MNPKISIIVPVYKVEPYLSKCIDSILTQTFTDFELILIDDGSPDRCGEICDEFAKKDSRIRVIHKENGGLSSARNAGIEAAQAEFIGFIDSDDFIHEKMYEILYIQAVLHSSDLVICDFLKVKEGEEAKFKKEVMEQSETRHFTNMEALDQLITTRSHSRVPKVGGVVTWTIACNKLYRRSLFGDIKFEEGRIFEDEYIIHKILYKSAKITFVPVKLYYYVKRPNSILEAPFSIEKLDKVYAYKERVDFLRAIEDKPPMLYEHAVKSYLDTFFWYYGKAKSELSHAKKEIRQLKRTLVTTLSLLLNSRLIGRKQKVYLVYFAMNPFK